MLSQQQEDTRTYKVKEQAPIPPPSLERDGPSDTAPQLAVVSGSEAPAKLRSQPQLSGASQLPLSQVSTSSSKTDSRTSTPRSRRSSFVPAAKGRFRARPSFSRRKSSQGITPQVTKSAASTRVVDNTNTVTTGRAPNVPFPRPTLDTSPVRILPPPGFAAADRPGFTLSDSSWQDEVLEGMGSSKTMDLKKLQ